MAKNIQLKIMKLKILKLSTIILLLIILGLGCKIEKIDCGNCEIIGEWQIIEFPKSCIGFGDIMIEITSDSVFKKHIDGELRLVSSFNTKAGRTEYDTIFFHNPESKYAYEFVALEGCDTLRLVTPDLTSVSTCTYYKRIN